MTFKILFLSHNGFPNRENPVRGIFHDRQVEALERKNINVTKAHITNENNDTAVESFPSVIGIRNFFNPKKFYNLFKIYDQHLKSNNYDCVIISFLSFWNLPYFYMTWRRDVNIILIIHGSDIVISGWIRKMITRMCMKLSSHIVLVSEFTYNILINRFDPEPSLQKKLQIIYNGPNIEFDSVHVCQVDSQKYGVDTSSKVFLCIANYTKRKNIEACVNYILEANKLGHDYHFIIVGDGEEFVQISNIIASSQFSHKFTLLARCSEEELSELYFLSDVYLQLSKSDWNTGSVEGFGITFLEAALHGLPVVTYSGAGPDTVLNDGISGFMLNPSAETDYVEIHRQVESALRMKSNRETKNLIRSHLMSKFSWNANASELLRLIKKDAAK